MRQNKDPSYITQIIQLEHAQKMMHRSILLITLLQNMYTQKM